MRTDDTKCIPSLAPDPFDLGIYRVVPIEGDQDALYVAFWCGCIDLMLRHRQTDVWQATSVPARMCLRAEELEQS